ncbi:NTP transferase domain-containing protein [Paenarthrobacter sp. PH39-S1]|uniref:molybdenum cofactor guanylyltransferase n=1 Tax=Paenarthrobacter sp. PH39-S1 TaxID=3046204 RepID=UPI0024BACD64|nr:NTP transferase domain-containing protein [Paenarthrobacter sp. PH39-S1]MDJ0354612.1 NTP transferase domain-containing protein [Paenarthrobacter sp. PH39-S1]
MPELAGSARFAIVGAIILAGGRSSRLGGIAKAALLVGGVSLLSGTVDAARGALHAGERSQVRRPSIVVVGPVQQLLSLLGPSGAGGESSPEASVPSTIPAPEVLLVREDPPYSGPAAAMAAGLALLTGTATAGAAPDTGAGGECVLVLACDMPHVSTVVSSLLRRLETAAAEHLPQGVEGWLASDQGRDQPLAAVYRMAPLLRAVELARASGSLKNASVFRLIASLDLVRVDVPAGSTADVDSWGDAAALGIDGIPGLSPPDAADDE